MARRIDPRAGGAPAPIPAGDMFPPGAIVGWEQLPSDYPNSEELSDLGVKLTEDELEALWGLDYPATGDKLGGWPAWVQGVEYPLCTQCNQPMHLVFQIDSEVNVPWMFGDAGIAHLTQCKQHKDELAFGWACS